MIVLKTDKELPLDTYDKWQKILKNMIDDGAVLIDGRFTAYNIDGDGKLERIEDEYGY